MRFLAMHIGSKLTNFEFRDAYVTDTGLTGFSRTCPDLKRFHLKSEVVEHDYDTDDSVEEELTDAGVQALTENCATLEDIALIKWTNITDLSMDYLSSITTLTRVQLSGCRKLTSAGIMRVLQTNPGLQHIDIANVLHADDSINSLVSSIGSGCPVLMSLKLLFAPPNKVTITSMLIVARSCPLLEVLDVKGFPQNDKYLVALSSSCPLLKYFTLTGSDVTDPGLLALTRGCRQLEALTMDNATHITQPSFSEKKKDRCKWRIPTGI